MSVNPSPILKENLSEDWMEALPFPIFGLSENYEFVFVNYAAEVLIHPNQNASFLNAVGIYY